MRFVSVRRKYVKGWLCLCIVKRWRPIYATWNAQFAKSGQLVEWCIMDEESFRRLYEEAFRGFFGR